MGEDLGGGELARRFKAKTKWKKLESSLYKNWKCRGPRRGNNLRVKEDDNGSLGGRGLY